MFCCSRVDKCLAFVVSFCWAMDCESLVTYSMTPAILFWVSASEWSICCCSSFIFVGYMDVQIFENFRFEKITKKTRERKKRKYSAFSLGWSQ